MGSRHIRKFLYCLSAVIITFSCIVFMGGWSQDYTGGSKQVLDSLDINAVLSDNGDMTVKETWKINLQNRDRPYRNIYRYFPNDTSKIDGISDLSVYDEDRKTEYKFAGDINPEDIYGNEMQDQCYLHKTADNIEIGWFMPEIDEGIRTFSVTYTVKNIVQVYSDTAELYNFFIPHNFSLPVANLHGTVHLPSGGEMSSLRAWLHTNISNSSIKRDAADTVSFTAFQIPAKTSVEARICMPAKLFPHSTRKTDQTVLPSIEKEENEQAQADKARRQREFLLGIIDAAGAAVVLLLSVFILVLVKNKNVRKKVSVPEYTRDIPPGNSPAGIANLFYFYQGIHEEEKSRVYSSTLLSLAQKGYIQFQQADSKKNIIIKISGDIKHKALTESEQVFYEMISTAAENYDNTFTMKQFRNYAETHYKYIDQQINRFFTASKREISARGYYSTRPFYLSILAGAGIFMILLAVALFFLSGSFQTLMVYLPLSMIIGGVLLLIAGKTKLKLSEKGETDYGIWHGLKKYMLEFSRMKEYGVPELPLWEEYLVYATMMGISKEVCKQLKVVYPQIDDQTFWDTYPTYTYIPFMFNTHFGVGIPGTTFDFGTELGNRIGEIESAAARLSNPPPSSGGSGFGGGGFGGGGFSGGGGGFGGGGGGGVR